MSQTNSAPAPSSAPPSQNPEPRDPFSPRAVKQLGLFFAGSAFMLASLAVTRRAITRKQIAAFPKYYQSNLRPPTTSTATTAAEATAKATESTAASEASKVDGGLIAAEALGLATLNVMSFALMATGGLSYAFDISSAEDLKRYARRKMYGPAGRPDEDAEKELEEWAAGILARVGKAPGQGKDAEGTVEKER